jgi:hypothetical protein
MSFFSGLATAVAPALVGGALNFLGAQSQNSANASRSASTMAFQKHMSSTAYQRAMVDMKKAGLNPILAYKQGGASSPAGAQIPAVNELENSVSSAMQATRLAADLKLVNAQTDLTKNNAKIAGRNAWIKEKETQAMQLIYDKVAPTFSNSAKNSINIKNLPAVSKTPSTKNYNTNSLDKLLRSLRKSIFE